MEPIRTLIVDDELLARTRIRNLLRGRSEFQIAGECANGREAVVQIEQQQPDLMFLDVQMPDLDGFGLVKSIDVERLPVIVFVTACDQYAVRAFECHALDYLLKPFDDERFEKTLSWAKAQIERNQMHQFSQRMLALLEEKRAALISRVVTRGLDPDAPLKPSGQEWLGEIPTHWGLQRLKQLAEVRGGLTLGKQYSGELLEYPYLRVANVQDGYLDLDDVLTVEVPASEAASNLLAKGDVLMNEGGDIDKLGRGCVWRDEIAPCLHQNHVFAVRPHSVDSDWLALWTSTLEAKRYFESRAKRSTNLASISGSNIKELPVPLPPIEEQLAIRQFLADRRHRLEKIRSELRHSLHLLKERRAALITAAVTGQIPLEEMSA